MRPRQTRSNPKKTTPNPVKTRQTVSERPSSSVTIAPQSQLLQCLCDSKQTTVATVKSLGILLDNLAADDAKRVAMKAVNASASATAAVHKSGWLYTSPTGTYTTGNVDQSILAAKLALAVLRERDAASSTERVALGLIGRLMAMKAVCQLLVMPMFFDWVLSSGTVPGI